VLSFRHPQPSIIRHFLFALGNRVPSNRIHAVIFSSPRTGTTVATYRVRRGEVGEFWRTAAYRHAISREISPSAPLLILLARETQQWSTIHRPRCLSYTLQAQPIEPTWSRMALGACPYISEDFTMAWTTTCPILCLEAGQYRQASQQGNSYAGRCCGTMDTKKTNGQRLPASS
jgi:hypothetical protein